MKTLLIIDDDTLCRRAAAELLRLGDWKIYEAPDGEQGLALALAHRPDVILCDLLMPRTNGFLVCRRVREHAELKDTWIVIMSGRDYPADRESAHQAGANDYLLKPVRAEDLYEALNRGGAKKSAPAEPAHGAPPETRPLPNGDGSMMLKFWGVRGSIPTPGLSTLHYGGNTSCVEVRAEGELIVLDAGTGIRGLGLALGKEFPGASLALTLLVTHTHWDHIQGFPFFMPAYNPNMKIRILGYEGASASLAATLAGQMESPYFPIPLAKMPGNLQIEDLRTMHFEVGKVRVEACFTKHPGICVGYRLFAPSGSIVYVPDNEWSNQETTALNAGGACAVESKLLEFVSGADVLIIDSQYNREEYKTHVGWGHGCVDDVVRLAIMAKVKRLYLFHHDPSHDDAFINGMVARAEELIREAGSTLPVEAAREGERLVLMKA
jgi:phosphoribosyl 1,2-cyclic phosphodiesterase/ActR/RegA family two-component response regulator